MTHILSQADYWGLFQPPLVILSTDPDDVTWHYPPQLGQGSLREMVVREDLCVHILHCQANQPLKITSQDRPHSIELTFDLLEASHCFYGSGMAPADDNQESPGQASYSLSIHLEPDLLKTWLQGSESALSQIDLLFRSVEQVYFTWDQPTSVEMQMIVHQLLHCPYQGSIKRMYWEAKILELMTLQIDHLLAYLARQKSKSEKHLLAEDIERIYEAQRILIQEAQDPPSLVKLAHQVGLNDYKLKVGFRQVFGTTVFGYLNQYRMEQVRQLLELGEMSVSAAAHRVGYSSLSHFTTTFRKRFGVNPSAYRRLHHSGY